MPRRPARPPLAPATADHEPALRPLTPAEDHAVAALTAGFAALGALRQMVAPSFVRSDVALATFPPARPVVHAAAALADALVDRWAPHATASPPADDALAAAASALTEAVADAIPADLRAALGRGAKHRSPGRPHRGTGRGVGRHTGHDEALAEAGTLLHEAALERCDADLYLATDRAGHQVVLSSPLPPATARLRLLEPLVERLEALVMQDDLLALERLAARWAFDRWSAPAPRDLEVAFPRTVREQEWSLAERETLALDAPIARAVLDDPEVTLPPRQRTLAAALDASTAGVYLVRERRDAVTVLESLADGDLVEVHEHHPGLAYAAGFLALGRLIPDFSARDEAAANEAAANETAADEVPPNEAPPNDPASGGAGRFLRSPGMAFLSPADASLPRTLADAVERVSETLPRALAVEAVLNGLLGTRPLPRDVPAAASPQAARELAQALHDELEAAGLVERVPASALPLRERAALLRDVGDQPPAELHFERMAVDDVVAEWVGALTTQARALAPGRRGGKARRRGR